MVASLYNRDQEKQVICVFLEQEGGRLETVSLELLSKGRELADLMGWGLVGLLMGHKVRHLSSDAFAYGTDQVWLADHSLLKHFTIDAFTHVTYHTLSQNRPSIFLLGATPNGRDLAGRLAVRLRTGLNADCTDLRMDKETGVLVCEVSGFGGGVLALIELQNHRPQMATVRTGVFTPSEPDPTRQGRIVDIPFDISEEMIHTRIIERVVGEQLVLARAPLLIAGGRGVDGDFQMLGELANLLGGEVGATRPPVDEGHIERERQIGQTGVVCSPKVAICCGISGAFHFVVGIEKADIVIAINNDPDAPIFDHADYCIVGDVHQIVPELIDTINNPLEVG